MKDKRHRHQDELGRIATPAAWGAGLGALLGGPKAALFGGAMGGGSQALGDAFLGQPDEHSFGAEMGRGALGGGILGAGIGAVGMGTHPEGLKLVKYLMQKGMGHKAAMAALLGGSALGGAANGALNEGLNSGFSNYEPDRRRR